MVLRPHSNRSRPPVPAPAGASGGAAPQGEGFLREVDEALREQELIDAAKRHGRIAGMSVLVFLALLAGYLWWDHRNATAAGAQGEALTLAIDQIEAGRLATAQTRLQPLTGQGDGIGAVARMFEASVLVEQGKPDQARARFAAVAADAGAPQPYRDMATIREIALGFETMPADRMVARLKPLAVPGAPYFGSAGELLGAVYLKQNRQDLAGPLFAAISRDKTVPESLRARARQMAGLLGVDAIDDVNEAANGGAGADNGR